jgi:hypothetical protein
MKSFYFLVFSIMLVYSAAYPQENGLLAAGADTLYAKQDWQAAAKAYENAFAKAKYKALFI